MAIQIFKKRSARFAQQNKLVRPQKLVKNSLTAFWMKLYFHTRCMQHASKYCFALNNKHSNNGLESNRVSQSFLHNLK